MTIANSIIGRATTIAIVNGGRAIEKRSKNEAKYVKCDDVTLFFVFDNLDETDG